MSSRSNSESDIEMKTVPFKKGKKIKLPHSPTKDVLREPKKITTKEMIHEALAELKTRKGVSYQAIKKYLAEKYQVDTEKMNFYIKKYLKTAVESGVIVQTKGIGATGSFRLVPVKKTDKKVEKSEKKVKKVKKTEKMDKIEQTKSKDKKIKEKGDKKIVQKKTDMKGKMDEPQQKKVKIIKQATEKTKKRETKMGKISKKDPKTAKSKDSKPPAKKKAAMMKRKSIGSIIKPPKMKPKAN